MERVPRLQHHTHGGEFGLQPAVQTVRQEMALHHARLRLRPYAATRRGDGSRETRRHRDRQRADAARHHRFLRLSHQGAAANPTYDPGAAAGLRHDQLPQADRAVRPQQADPCGGHPAGARSCSQALPPEARIGIWMFEWYWKQPGVPGVDKFVADIRNVNGGKVADRAPLVRLHFGDDASRGVANQQKTLDSVKLAEPRWTISSCRPMTSSCSRTRCYYRKGDHQLMTSAFVGEAQSKGASDPEDLFRVDQVVRRRQDGAGGRRRRHGCEGLSMAGLQAAMTQLLLFNVTNGLIIGAFYALMALGLSLILNLSNVINFAHGGFLVIGGYIAYTITPYIGFWGALLMAPPAHRRHRPRRRAGADPSALWPRSALQPAADLRPGLHHRGRHALHLGAAGQAGDDSSLSGATAEQRVLLHHRLSPVHGGRGDDRGDAVVLASALYATRRSYSRRHARPRDGRGTGR